MPPRSKSAKITGGIMELKAAQARTGFLPALILLGAMAIPAAAQEGCTGFGWPMAAEIAWMTAADSQAVETRCENAGACRQSNRAEAEAFEGGHASSKVRQEEAGHCGDSYSGWIRNRGTAESRAVSSVSLARGLDRRRPERRACAIEGVHGRKDCKAVHKSVRFELGAGPVIVEISGAPVETVKVSVREVN